jgi:hypothetical protein
MWKSVKVDVPIIVYMIVIGKLPGSQMRCECEQTLGGASATNNFCAWG